MRRQSKSNATKTRSRKPGAIKRHQTPASRHHPGHRPDRSIDQLRRELDEAREQQAAAADVLRIVSASTGEVKPVFQAILNKAVRICEAKFGILTLYEGNSIFRTIAMHNLPPAYARRVAERRDTLGVHAHPLSALGRVAATKRLVQVFDYSEELAYKERDPVVVDAVELGRARTLVTVPMLKEDTLAGAITIYRQEVRQFTDKQIALVQNFAAQAVIAIENARLLNELRQRTTDLAETVEQQTAASQVLSIISSSPADLGPVFQAILANATQLCSAKFGNLNLYDGEVFRIAAFYNVPPEYAEARQRHLEWRPHPRGIAVEMVRTKQPVQIDDVRTMPAYRERDPIVRAIADMGGARTLLLVPMLKDVELVGMIGIYRKEVRPFTDKQIALVQNFAAQAVIAIENARLLNELRQRTTDLSESLQQQTATSEVLGVISSSLGDLQPVFEVMLENAIRLCEANFGNLFVCEGNGFRSVAVYSPPSAYTEWYEHHPLFDVKDHPQAPLARLAESREIIHIADLRLDRGYAARVPVVVAFADNAGARTVLLVPMLKEGKLIGAIVIYRTEVRPFSEKQIELIQNFAAQAVIAIENARLLSELRESYKVVQQQAGTLEAQSQELIKLNQQLEQRVSDQVSEIERMSRLRRFLPPQVADLIVASGTEKQLESHRREITALFCDLRGFTGFSESSDPEDVMALLRDYHAAIGEIIIKYSGTLERFAGDGVMVIFNDPVPVPNPALQAVRMALDMRVTIGALIERWRRLGHDLGFGIGIAHGFATLGTIGFEGRFDYAAIGTVSNVASRLCDEAKPGQILISPRVLLEVEDAVTVEAVGDFELKGIRRPVAAYNVLDAKHSN
jgi:class 3 adenylate cyclase/putative methionine-R-sulfoxide reductase with GAF domain